MVWIRRSDAVCGARCPPALCAPVRVMDPQSVPRLGHRAPADNSTAPGSHVGRCWAPLEPRRSTGRRSRASSRGPRSHRRAAWRRPRAGSWVEAAGRRRWGLREAAPPLAPSSVGEGSSSRERVARERKRGLGGGVARERWRARPGIRRLRALRGELPARARILPTLARQHTPTQRTPTATVDCPWPIPRVAPRLYARSLPPKGASLQLRPGGPCDRLPRRQAPGGYGR
jgi:hypothetical protein